MGNGSPVSSSITIATCFSGSDGASGGSPDAAGKTPALPFPIHSAAFTSKRNDFSAGVTLRISEREWRARGVENNTSFDLLKVNLRLLHNERFHLDTLDFPPFLS